MLVLGLLHLQVLLLQALPLTGYHIQDEGIMVSWVGV